MLVWKKKLQLAENQSLKYRNDSQKSPQNFIENDICVILGRGHY